MTSVVLSSLLSATLLALAIAALKRYPTRQRCPKCAEATEAVLLPSVLRPVSRWVQRRWCSACSWSGLGRRGPELVVGRRIAHDSGFHWGARRAGPDLGFEWRRPEVTAPQSEPPDHPSGFRFARSDPAASVGDFAWRTPLEEAEFRWKRRPDDSDKKRFRWRGVA